MPFLFDDDEGVIEFDFGDEGRVPRVGEIVLFKLRLLDVQTIREIRMGASTTKVIGNQVEVGQAYPMVIVRVWGDSPASCVNGHLLLDGQDTRWVTSVRHGGGEGEFLYSDERFQRATHGRP